MPNRSRDVTGGGRVEARAAQLRTETTGDLEAACAGTDSSLPLRTNRLLIRSACGSDAERLREMLRVSARVFRHGHPTAHVAADDAAYDEISLLLEDSGPTEASGGGGRGWRRVAEHDGRLVGAARIESRGDVGPAELVAWISGDAQGNGYADELVRAVADHAIASRPRGLGLGLLYTRVAPANSRLIQVCERAGFHEAPGVPMRVWNIEGVARTHVVLVREAIRAIASQERHDWFGRSHVVVRRGVGGARINAG